MAPGWGNRAQMSWIFLGICGEQKVKSSQKSWAAKHERPKVALFPAGRLWRAQRSGMKAPAYSPCGAAVGLPVPGSKVDHEKT
jgi:hypothetical protein